MRRLIISVVLFSLFSLPTRAGEVEPGVCALALPEIQDEVMAARQLIEIMDSYTGPNARSLDSSAVYDMGSAMFNGVELERFMEYANSMIAARLLLEDYLQKLDAFAGALMVCVENTAEITNGDGTGARLMGIK